MRTTFACRDFTDDPVEDEVLYRILDVARFAPSGGNRQGQRVIVVKDPATRKALDKAGGNRAAMERYQRELPGAEVLDEDAPFWRSIREFTPDFFAAHPAATLHQRSTPLQEQAAAIAALPGPVVARVANGVSYGHAIDDAAPHIPPPGGFEIMTRVKRLFDPDSLLNPGRLHGLL